MLQRRFAGAVAGAKPKILITGCLGQVGTALVRLLRFQYGAENVIASDTIVPSNEFYGDGPFMYADVTQYNMLAKVAVDEGVNWVIHNSSIPSVCGEGDPSRAMDVHINGIRNVLELAKNLNLRVLAPSSIATFSEESGLDNTPDLAVMKPTTIYGVTKCFQENIGIYYHKKYGVDFRSLRYPGIISTLEEGSNAVLSRKLYKPTTDDYVMMSLHAYKNGTDYVCGLDKDQLLPFMYIDDCLVATETLLEADEASLSKRVYNTSGCTFSPQMFEDEVRKYLPDFKLKYEVDYRNEIAASWPNTVDSSAFTKDLQWSPTFDLAAMVRENLQRMKLIKPNSKAGSGRLEVSRAVSVGKV